MGTFNTKAILDGPVSLIPVMADRIGDEFRKDGYEVDMAALSSGGYDISVTKGGVFKAVMGLKTALKVTLLPYGNGISFEAGVGIFGQQVIPTMISMFFFWPVLITQIWGMVQQSQLDDKALGIARAVISSYSGQRQSASGSPSASSGAASGSPSGSPDGFAASGRQFCISCGTENPASARFCCGCGKMLE